MENEQKLPPGFWVGLVVVLCMLFLSLQHCHGQAVYDTIPIKYEQIHKFVEQPTKNGNTRTYAVTAMDQKGAILDLIPVNKSVYEYIQLCKSNGIKPSLGIRFKNGQVSSIIRFKRRYVCK